MKSHEYTAKGNEVWRVFLRPIFGAAILSMVIHAAGWFELWPGPQAGLVTDEVFLAHQRQASRQSHPADLVLVGDSSCSAGVDAPILESLLPGGEGVVNLGLTIGLGMDVYADALVSFLDSNPGRVKWVILLVTPARLGSESSDEDQRQIWNRLSAEAAIGEEGWPDLQWVLGLSALNSRVWPRVWHRPLKGKAAYFYGFGSSFRDYLVAHRGSMVDCAEYAPPIHPQAVAYQLSEFVKEESRRFRSQIPRGVQLAIGISPIPEGQAERSFEREHRALLLEWNLSMAADCLLTNLPARLPDGMFATGAHLNARGQRWYSQRLVRELQGVTASRFN